MVAQVPLTPVVNKGLSYLNGLGLTYASATTFTVAQGQCRNSTNVNDIVLARPPLNDGTAVTTAFTCDITTSGAGGLDTGTIAASTLYYVFAISSSENSWINLPPSPQQSLSVPPFTTPSSSAAVTQSVDYVQANVLISLSATAPLLPYGFDQFRRIGCISTDGSTHVRQFVQTGSGVVRRMYYDVPVAPGSAATGGSTAFASIGTLATLVPQIACDALIDVSLIGNSAGNALYLAPYGATASAIYAQMSTVVTTLATLATLTVPMGLNAGVATVNYRTTSASDTVAFLVQGYIDQL